MVTKIKPLSIDPFQMAMQAVSFGASLLEQKSATARSRKKDIFRMQKDLEENLIGLKNELGGRASARGLGSGQYDRFVQSAEKVGRKQIDFSKFEAELEDMGYFTDLWRSLTGGRNRSKITKDLGRTKNEIIKMLDY